MKKKIIAVLFMALIAGASAHPASAKEAIAEIGITGTGIRGELVLKSRQDLNRFADGWWWLIGFRYGSNASPKPLATPVKMDGPVYTLTRYQQIGSQRVAFDQLRYYPTAGGGITFFVGYQMQGHRSDYDGKWFHANPAADVLMQQVFQQRRITPSAAKRDPAKTVITP